MCARVCVQIARVCIRMCAGARARFCVRVLAATKCPGASYRLGNSHGLFLADSTQGVGGVSTNLGRGRNRHHDRCGNATTNDYRGEC